MNLATVWETVAATVPDAPATIHRDQVHTWRTFEDRAARLAAIGVVYRVDLPVNIARPTGARDRAHKRVQGGSRIDDAIVGRAVVVLDLFERDQIRRTQVVHHDLRELAELRRCIERV